MHPRHVAILGGSGFVGRRLVARLLADGHRATVLGRDDGAAARAAFPDGVEVRTGDVHDAGFLRDALAGADAVANLAGILNEDGDDGRGFERVYVALAATLFDAMRALGIRRLLQMSALGAGTGGSHYLQARGRAEALARGSGLDWTLFRPSVIAGPGDGLFCRFAGLLRYLPVLPLGRAEALFQPVWVDDVAEAFARALVDDTSIGHRYDLVGPDRFTLADIVGMTARANGWRRVVLPLPAALGRLQAETGEHLPGKPISRDNWRSLQLDSTSDDDGLAKLGIRATPIPPRLAEIMAGCR